MNLTLIYTYFLLIIAMKYIYCPSFILTLRYHLGMRMKI